jgi:hypothetical protein
MQNFRKQTCLTARSDLSNKNIMLMTYSLGYVNTIKHGIANND